MMTASCPPACPCRGFSSHFLTRCFLTRLEKVTAETCWSRKVRRSGDGPYDQTPIFVLFKPVGVRKACSSSPPSATSPRTSLSNIIPRHVLHPLRCRFRCSRLSHAPTSPVGPVLRNICLTVTNTHSELARKELFRLSTSPAVPPKVTCLGNCTMAGEYRLPHSPLLYNVLT